MADYQGAVAFVDGVHYPVFPEDHDEAGHADLSRPLRWNPDTSAYRDAEEGEPLHNDVYHQGSLELEFEGEAPIQVTADEAGAVKDFLAQRRGEQ